MDLIEKIRLIKEKLTDPFTVEGLKEEVEELYELIGRAEPEEIRKVADDFEEIKRLLEHNIKVIEGSLEIFLKHFQGGFISRRV